MNDRIGFEYMQQSRLPTEQPSPQRQGLPRPLMELPYPEQAQLIPLPPPAEIVIPALDLRAAIENRTTLRQYSPQSLSLAELSFLLWCTQGVKKTTGKNVTLRNVPSAGARHAFETYILINRVEGLPPGLYRYIALQHALLEIDLSSDISRRFTFACYDQEHVNESAASFFWVAVLERMTWRYGLRGYRYLHLDAGHVCQNLYLAAEAIGSGVCAIAAFKDDDLNSVLNLDGEELFAIYAASLGKKRES